MKSFIALLLALLMLCAALPLGSAESPPAENSDNWYAIGAQENTLDGVYRRLCVNLDLHTHPIPEADAVRNRGAYTFGEYEETAILINDESAYEVIGTVFTRIGSAKYLIHRWIGYQDDGDIIGMDVYYSLDGKYIGNIRHNYTKGMSTPSHRCPYAMPGEPLMK